MQWWVDVDMLARGSNLSLFLCAPCLAVFPTADLADQHGHKAIMRCVATSPIPFFTDPAYASWWLLSLAAWWLLPLLSHLSFLSISYKFSFNSCNKSLIHNSQWFCFPHWALTEHIFALKIRGKNEFLIASFPLSFFSFKCTTKYCRNAIDVHKCFSSSVTVSRICWSYKCYRCYY